MTKPFQYDNFVQSQIAMGPSYDNGNFGSYVRRDQDQPRSRNVLETSNGNQSRHSLKQKINELLGLCKQENQGMKANFRQVLGTEKQILNLIKQQFDQAPRFNNYARSNVQMFPAPSQNFTVGPSQQNHGYDEDQRPRAYQSLPNHKNVNNPANYQQQQQPYIPSQQYQQPRYQQPQYFPQQTYPQTQYNEQPYVTDYTSGVPQPGYGYGPAPVTNDRANILRSKVLQLKEENNRLKNMANQNQYPQQDLQVRQLQQEVFRLKNVVQNYQNQLANLGNSPKNINQRNYLRQLLDQGERIRQDTIALLKLKSNPNYSNGFVGSTSNYGGNGGNGGYGAYGGTGGTGTLGTGYNDYAAGGRRGLQGLTNQQHSILKAQLNELRRECQELHQQNANIKRTSKGTNFTSGSRRY